MPHDLTVTHNQAEHRFEALVEGQLSVAEYQLNGGRMVFTHTEVPARLRGRGIANQLAHAALEYAREQNLAVVPLCWFIAEYIQRHPEYQPLRAQGA